MIHNRWRGTYKTEQDEMEREERDQRLDDFEEYLIDKEVKGADYNQRSKGS